jgi:hypothetical protein
MLLTIVTGLVDAFSYLTLRHASEHHRSAAPRRGDLAAGRASPSRQGSQVRAEVEHRDLADYDRMFGLDSELG